MLKVCKDSDFGTAGTAFAAGLRSSPSETRLECTLATYLAATERRAGSRFDEDRAARVASGSCDRAHYQWHQLILKEMDVISYIALCFNRVGLSGLGTGSLLRPIIYGVVYILAEISSDLFHTPFHFTILSVNMSERHMNSLPIDIT